MRNINKVLTSPYVFLSGIDIENRAFLFLETNREVLSKSAFIDGRETISSKQHIRVSFEDVFSSKMNTAKKSESRFIFHMAFCGSTLLARTLDVKGKSLSYKEPQVFIDLSTIKASNHALYKDKNSWGKLLAFTLSKFDACFTDQEQNIIKPSNWVNTIADDLLLNRAGQKALLLTIEPKDFLIAVFRGGGDRVRYIHSFLQHMAKGKQDLLKVIDQIEKENKDTVSLFSKLVLLAYAIQKNKLHKTSKLLSKEQILFMDHKKLINEPMVCIEKASTFFDLRLTPIEIEESIKRNFRNHSKVVGRAYNNKEMGATNDKVLAAYGGNFEETLEWYDDNYCASQ